MVLAYGLVKVDLKIKIFFCISSTQVYNNVFSSKVGEEDTRGSVI